MATPDFIKAPLALVTNFFLPHPEAPRVSLSGKRILVTGATPGSIGFETAKCLSEWGAEVIVTVRSETSRQDCLHAFESHLSNGKAVKIMQLDLSSVDSVNDFCTKLSSQYDTLDVLVNNAGVYLDMLGSWKQEKLSEDGCELHLRINYFGMLQLSNALFPLLKRAAKKNAEARVINVSSHMHDNCCNEELFEGLKPYKSVKAYGRSKLAMMHLTFFLHKQLYESSGVKFICLHPGSVYTNLVEKGLQETPWLVWLRNKFSFLERMILLNPWQGAQTQIMCASASDVESGVYYRRCSIERPAETLNNHEIEKKLWQLSEAWLMDHKQTVHLK